MKRIAFNSIIGVFLRSVLVAMALSALANPSRVWGAEPTSVASPAPKPDRTQLEAQFAKANADRAAAAEESKKKDLRKAIDALEKSRYVMRYNAVTMLENVARENNDSAGLVKYAEAELEIRRMEMDYLQRSGAPKQEIKRKNVEVATSMERIADAQADLALFDKAEKNYLEALAIRRALPEDMAERKMEDTLSALGGMYAHNVGDFVKARDYYQQALASVEIN